MIDMAAVVVAVAVGLLAAAWWLRWLTARGTAVAAAVGAAVFAGAGAGGLALLLLFFVTSSALTMRNPARVPAEERVGGAERPQRSKSFVPAAPDGDAGGRGGRQVLANGGVAAACALLGLAGWLPLAHYAVAGALAAATADTWATETGTARAGETRLITSWERVPPGRSGGVSAAGTLAGLAGALLIGAGAGLFLSSGVLGRGLLAAFAGGLAGMTVDSLLGATLEARVERIDNDAVNLAGTLAGAGVAWSLGALLFGV